jgi:hypothetical protein
MSAFQQNLGSQDRIIDLDVEALSSIEESLGFYVTPLIHAERCQQGHDLSHDEGITVTLTLEEGESGFEERRGPKVFALDSQGISTVGLG